VRALAFILTLSLAGVATARPAPAPAPAPSEPSRTTPAPEDATGVAATGDRRTNQLMWIPRAILFVPRWTLWLAVQPIRAGLWAYERYALGTRIKSIFFNDDETLGAYPLAFFETGFGLNVGARLIYRDLFGAGGRLRLRASYGGRFRQVYSAKATTGTLLGDRAELQVETSYAFYPKSIFMGLGNGELVAPAAVMAPVDPTMDGTAVRTRYRHDDVLGELSAVVHLHPTVDLRLIAQYRHRSFNPDIEPPDDEVPITDVYLASGLTGYDQGLSSAGAEIELIRDTRRGTRFWVSDANPNAGSKLSGFAGTTVGMGDDPSRYLRYGLDALRVFDLYDGTRMLHLRAYLEGVTGSLDRVPFTDLPRLGGPIFLRGYERDRFRDRLAAVGTAEYRYYINKYLAGYVFVDAGRVYRGLDELSANGLRVGYGGGVQAHTATTLRGRFDVSSSIDGGLFFNLGFDPVFDTSSRKESL
jgi:outer membrane protein assembly factor BamA